MKICSRPKTEPVGTGSYTLNLTFEQLELIAAYLHVTRLGTASIYSHSAFQLIRVVEELFDDGFTSDAAENVDLCASVLNDDDDVIEQHHYVSISLEV
jgi:hypothetical protein